MAEYTMWAGGAPPWEPAAFGDGEPSIRTAVGFYATTTTWYVVGAQLRAPAASGLGLCTLSLRVTANGVPPDLAAPPVASAQVAVDAGAGWFEARWPGVEVVAPNAIWISLDSEDGQHYLFVAGGTVGTDFVQAAGGVDLYMAEADHPRGAYRIGEGATTSASTLYGVFPIVSDEAGPPPPTGGSAADVGIGAAGAGLARHLGGSATGVGLDATGAGMARRRGSSAAGVGLAATTGAGQKRARGGSATAVGVLAVGSGYNPDDLPDLLPTTGSLAPLTPGRGLAALTPARGLEPA